MCLCLRLNAALSFATAQKLSVVQSKELKWKRLLESCRNVSDNNSKQSELHIGFVCCNLRRRKLVVADDNKLVAVFEPTVLAFLRPTTHVHNSPLHDCARCVMLLMKSALPKPQVSRRQIVVEATTKTALSEAVVGGGNL